MEKIGKGRPLVIVSGGPGLSYKYLKKPLLPLAERFELCFYNQLGTGADQTKDVTANQTFNQFKELVEPIAVEDQPILFGHSWGSHVILESHIKYCILSNFTNLVLCNPAPLTRANNTIVGGNLFARLSNRNKNKIATLSSEAISDENGKQIMNLARQAYCSPKKTPPKIDFEYRREVYNSVDSSLGDYSLTNVSIPKNIDLTLIYGEDDYIDNKFTEHLQQFAKRIFLLPNTGHFSVSESPEAVLTILRGLG